MDLKAGATESPPRQDLQSIATSALKVGLFTGGAGVFIGGIQGIIYSDAPALFTAFSTLQWLTTGTTYWAARSIYLHRHGLLSKSHKELLGLDVDAIDTFSASERKTASAVGGALSGAITAAATRGKRNILPGMIMFSVFGYTGQVLVNRWQDTQDAKEMANEDSNSKTFWQRLTSSKYSPVKIMSDAEYEDMLKEKRLRIETDIALIDDSIAHLKQMRNQIPIQEKRD